MARVRRATATSTRKNWWNMKDWVFFFTMVLFVTLAIVNYLNSYHLIKDDFFLGSGQMSEGLQMSMQKVQQDAKKVLIDNSTRKDFVLDEVLMKDPLVGMLLAKNKYLPSSDEYKKSNQLINAKALRPVLGTDFIPTNILRDHRAPPNGMKVHAPWASGLSLRLIHQEMPLPVKGEDSSMILYAHPFDDEYTSHNFCFYVEMLSWSFHIMEATSSPYAHKNVTHVFIVHTVPTVSDATYEALLRLSDELNFPFGHTLDIISLSTGPCVGVRDGLTTSGCSLAELDWRAYASLIFLDSTMAGPILPKYWAGTGFDFWAEAYTSRLSKDVRLVGGKVSCLNESDSDLPGFVNSPLAMDPSVVDILARKGFEMLRSDLLKLVLQAGFNFETLHGQAAGIDWKKFAGNENVICGGTTSNFGNSPYELHPYETLFISNSQDENSLAGKRYIKWTQGMIDTLITPRRIPREEERVLIAFAYFEKNEEYKSNLMYFLEMTVLRDARLGIGKNVNYVIIVNGDHTVDFPAVDNLTVLQRDNTCFDFGSWAVALKDRKEDYKYFLLMNSSVRGPFLPKYFQQHWTEAMLSLLIDRTHLVGLAVNCPDGIGDLIPHVMTMAMAMTQEAVKVGFEKGIFNCAGTYKSAVRKEGRWSKTLLENGFNIDSMQAKYSNQNWGETYKHFQRAPREKCLHANEMGFNVCNGIDLDIFFQEGWYDGLSPHPIEFIFYKTNRNVAMTNMMALSEIKIFETRNEVNSLALTLSRVSSNRETVLLMSHSLDGDGAPRMLAHLAMTLPKLGYNVVITSPTNGHLGRKLADIGITVIVQSITKWVDMEDLMMKYSPKLVLLNTITWTPLVEDLAKIRPEYPKIAWMLHENEIVEGTKTEKGYWYGDSYPVLRLKKNKAQLISKVDRIIFVADAVRALWSEYDHGNFETFKCFINLHETVRRSGIIKHKSFEQFAMRRDVKMIQETLQSARRETRGNATDFVITLSGTYCTRKRQLWLIDAVHEVRKYHPFVRLQLLGKPSAQGGNGEIEYANEVQRRVKEYGMERFVDLLPFSKEALKHVAAASLHVSVSSHEAFPLNTLEAMLLGAPVAMTPAGGSEEQLRQPGWDGFMFPDLTGPDQLASELLNIIAQGDAQLDKIGRRGQETVLSRFTDMDAPARVEALVDHIMPQNPTPAPNGSVCIVVRTYVDQIKDKVFSLEKMLQSLKVQNYPHWTALIVQTDLREMDGLYGLLSRLDDHRFRIISYEKIPRYESGAFEITDRVISEQCAPDTDWLLVTNGDNWYDPTFFDHLDLEYDGIAYDFYSRSVNIFDAEVSGSGCSKYFGATGASCKRNVLKHWHTDLGANVLNLKRWRVEQRSFMPLNEEDGSADGHVAESLVHFGWLFKHVGGESKCFFSHSPNIYGCLVLSSGNYWVDELQQCVSSDVGSKRIEKGESLPYESSSPPEGTEAYQGRCLDTPCPKHREFIQYADLKPVYFFDESSRTLFPVTTQDAQDLGKPRQVPVSMITRCPPLAVSKDPFQSKMLMSATL